jgi:hypothetical protein
MPWTQEQHDAAQKRVADFIAEYSSTVEQWRNSVQAGQATQGEAAVQDVLRRWRQFTLDLQEQSAAATANQGTMDLLGKMVTEVTEHKKILAELESEAATRVDQADSLNPKVRASPYTNILGLQRTFRDSTRTAILIISIVFGVLALATMAYLIYRMMAEGSLVRESIGLRSASGLGGGV